MTSLRVGDKIILALLYRRRSVPQRARGAVYEEDADLLTYSAAHGDATILGHLGG